MKRGEGKIIEHHGKKVAASRGPVGVLSLRSAICTHMGCLVKWNDAEPSAPGLPVPRLAIHDPKAT